MILGIDTSGAQCAVALVDGDRVVRRALPMARGHAEALMPMIEDVLAEAGVGFDAVSRIGVCVGPGSFTGIRVGVAAARGMALGLGIPAVGVGRLEALAATAPGAPLRVGVPGPQGAVYVQDFDGRGCAEGGPRLAAAGEAAPAGRATVGGDTEGALADPAVIARLSADRCAKLPPAPLYLRNSGAAPPREAPPPLLDP